MGEEPLSTLADALHAKKKQLGNVSSLGMFAGVIKVKTNDAKNIKNIDEMVKTPGCVSLVTYKPYKPK